MDFYTKILLENIDNILKQSKTLSIVIHPNNKLIQKIIISDIALMIEPTLTCKILSPGLWKGKDYFSIFNIKANAWIKINPLIELDQFYYINIYIMRYGL